MIAFESIDSFAHMNFVFLSYARNPCFDSLPSFAAIFKGMAIKCLKYLLTKKFYTQLTFEMTFAEVR